MIYLELQKRIQTVSRKCVERGRERAARSQVGKGRNETAMTHSIPKKDDKWKDNQEAWPALGDLRLTSRDNTIKGDNDTADNNGSRSTTSLGKDKNQTGTERAKPN